MMTPAELEYGSIRYSFSPLLIVPLSSGLVAVGEGFNPFPLIRVCEWAALADELRLLTEDQASRAMARALANSRRLRLEEPPIPGRFGLTLKGI